MANVIFFGSLSDRVTESELSVDLGNEAKTAREIFDAIAASSSQLHNAYERTPIKVAINQKLSDWDDTVTDSDELAFLPPVTGG